MRAGDHLDPLEVLQALPPGMPLSAATSVLGPMLADRLHRRRQGALAKNLQRARLAGAAGALCDAQARHVNVGADRACPHCHLRLGGKVFVVLQPGVAPGGKGGGSPGAGAAAATAASFEGTEGTGALRPPGEDPLAAAAQRLQQAAAAGQEPHVLCYACYRRLSGAATGGMSPAAAGAAPGGAMATPAAAAAAAVLPHSPGSAGP